MQYCSNGSKATYIHMYNQQAEKTKSELFVKMKNSKINEEFEVFCTVLDNSAIHVPIIGSTAAQRIKLITVYYENILLVEHSSLLTREAIPQEYSDVFEGTGELEDEYHLALNPEMTPVVHPPRGVPVSIKPQL